MTHDEMIAVIQAHKEGKLIEMHPKDRRGNHWMIREKPTWNFEECLYRVKPEPKVIPWTIKDAEIFLGKILTEKLTLETYRVTSCNLKGLFMRQTQDNEYESVFFLYETVFDNFIFNGNPCGKVVL